MAIYHCVAKPLSRRTGRSAVAAAAYRACACLRDELQRRDAPLNAAKKAEKAQGFAHGARVGSGPRHRVPRAEARQDLAMNGTLHEPDRGGDQRNRVSFGLYDGSLY
jgi:hypothetical protein